MPVDRPPVRRRTLLSALGATAVAGLARFASGTLPGTPLQTADGGRPDRPSAPVRCRGDPVSVERSVADAPGYGDDIEYYPENGTVRYVELMSSDGPASYGEMSFRQWASIECAEAGLERVREATADRLDTDAFGSGIGKPPGLHLPAGFLWSPLVVFVSVSTLYEGDEVVSTPSVPVTRLAAVAPRSVEATVSLDGDSYSRTVPVFAEYNEVAQL